MQSYIVHVHLIDTSLLMEWSIGVSYTAAMILKVSAIPDSVLDHGTARLHDK